MSQLSQYIFRPICCGRICLITKLKSPHSSILLTSIIVCSEILQLFVFGDGRQGKQVAPSCCVLTNTGQLGHGQTDTQNVPMLLNIQTDGKNKAIKQICCGAHSSWVVLGMLILPSSGLLCANQYFDTKKLVNALRGIYLFCFLYQPQ